MDDSDVKLKHKVRLRKKIEDPIADPTSLKLKGLSWKQQKFWVRIVVFVVIFVVICIIIYSLAKTTGNKIVEIPKLKIETVTDSPVPIDTVAGHNADIEEAFSNNDDEVANTIEEQSSAIIDTSSTVDNTSNVSSSTSTNVTTVSNDVEAEAMKVIRGDYGVGQERKDKLGPQYRPIQNRVNQLKKEGAF